MGFKKTFLLFLILIVLGGYYYLFERGFTEGKGRAEKAQKAPELKKIFNFLREDIIDVRISRGSSENIHYQRNSKGWQMVEPQLIQGDASSLDGFLEDVQNISEVESVSEHPVSVTEFGLDNPSFTIVMKAKGSIPPKTLFLGNDHPTHTTIYARTSDSLRVFIVGSLVRWDIDKEFDNLKNKRGPFFKTGQ
jgi:hypothetical protein